MDTDDTSVKNMQSTLKAFNPGESHENHLCKYIHQYCFQKPIQGYDFCIRHILEDKNAPFRQCTFIQQCNKKKCTNAAPKSEKSDRHEALCSFHAKQSILKVKTPIVRKKVIKGPKALLKSLEHYCHNAHHDASYSKEINRTEKCEIAYGIQFPASLKPSMYEFDIAEKSSSEKYSGHTNGFEDHRNWGMNSNYLLRHAGVFTAKELIALAREKAMHLKTLYVDELKRTYYRLKELRRKYLLEVKVERRKHSGKPLSASKSKMLRYLETYHSPFGIDKVLRQKCKEKRMGVISHMPECTFQQNGKKCTQTAIVSTSYCLNHILSDSNQCLFVPCSVISKKKCDRPVLPFCNNFSVCKLHLFTSLIPGSKEGQIVSSTHITTEQEHFQSMDDIASLGLDDITPGSLFGLDQFGEPGESTDVIMSEEQADLMQMQPITFNPPADILSDARKSNGREEEK